MIKKFDQKIPALNRVWRVRQDGRCEVIVKGTWLSHRLMSAVSVHSALRNLTPNEHYVLAQKDVEDGYVVMDRTCDQGLLCRLNRLDADALRQRGYNISTKDEVRWHPLQIGG